LWKTIIAFRIDLTTNNMNSRYILRDCGNCYDVYTDDYGMIEFSIKDKREAKPYLESSKLEIERYNSIFEVAFQCLYLPEYFNTNDNLICNEEHPTLLIDKKLKPNIVDKKQDYYANYFHKYRNIFVIDKNLQTLESGSISFDKNINIERNGYWKQIGIGKIGKDKNGNPVHNRTWVEQTITWHESVSNNFPLKNVIITKSERSGWIYIMRNPTHSEGIWKIGLTTRVPIVRAKELSKTSNPDKFYIYHKYNVDDCSVIEKLIHNKLEQYRVDPKREFFKIEPEKACEIIEEVINEYGKQNNKRVLINR